MCISVKRIKEQIQSRKGEKKKANRKDELIAHGNKFAGRTNRHIQNHRGKREIGKAREC